MVEKSFIQEELTYRHPEWSYMCSLTLRKNSFLNPSLPSMADLDRYRELGPRGVNDRCGSPPLQGGIDVGMLTHISSFSGG